MAIQVSVILTLGQDDSPGEAVRALDAQTLAPDQFEVVLVNAGLSESERASLDRLAARRPNVRVVAAGEDWPSGLIGDYLVSIRSSQLLFPEALARLVDFAALHNADAVAGREVNLNQPLLATYFHDTPAVAPELVGSVIDGPLVLYRRYRTSISGAGITFDADGARVAVLASYPATRVTSSPTVPGVAITVDRPELRWDGNAIALTVTGTADSASGALTPQLQIRKLGSFESYPIDTEGRQAGAEGLRWLASGRITPATAAAGSPLSNGEWQVDVVLAGADQASVPTRLPGASLPVGVVDDLVVLTADQPRDSLYFDVGPSRRPLIARADAAAAAVVESAAGCVMSVRLPDWHIVGSTGPIEGAVALGRLRLPATIALDSGEAILTAFVSGLAGRSPISASFGLLGLQPIGLDLQISGTGAMTVVPSPPPDKPEPKLKAVKAARPAPKRRPKAKKPVRKVRPTGPVAKVRRALPSSWEPKIHRVAQVPALRKAYRRLTGLSKS